jgi:hypothetical protein
MEPEVYKEIKIFMGQTYGISIENFRKDVGGDGITIANFEIDKSQKMNYNGGMVCLTIEEAKLVLEHIGELLKGYKK